MIAPDNVHAFDKILTECGGQYLKIPILESGKLYVHIHVKDDCQFNLNWEAFLARVYENDRIFR